jgi:hypothetical protein
MIDRQDERIMRGAHVLEAADGEHLLPGEQRQAAHQPGIERTLRRQGPAHEFAHRRTSSVAARDIGSVTGPDRPLRRRGAGRPAGEPHRRFALQNDETFATV